MRLSLTGTRQDPSYLLGGSRNRRSTSFVLATKTDDPKTKTTTATQNEVQNGEKPGGSPGWIIIEEEWWSPFQFDFSDSLHRARVHYRTREEEAGSCFCPCFGCFVKTRALDRVG